MTWTFDRRLTLFGLGVSLAGHAALFAVLTAVPDRSPVEIAENRPMAVRIVSLPASAPQSPIVEPREAQPERAEPEPVEEPVTVPPKPEAKLSLPKSEAVRLPPPRSPPPPPPAPVAPARPAAVASAPEIGTPSTANPSAADNWEGKVIARLEQKKRYPGSAIRARMQDVIYVRLTVNREGRIIDSRIVKSRGHAPLENAVADLLVRANPLPALPAAIPGSSYSFIVPIDFFMR